MVKDLKDYTISANIVSIDLVPEDKTRLRLQLNKELQMFNPSTGELQRTFTFSKKVMALLQQLVELQVPQARLLLGMCLGHNPNPQIIVLLLLNSKIEVLFKFRKQGEKRENGKDVYDSDTFVPEIKKIELHIDKQFDKIIGQLILDRPIMNTSLGNNPFDI